MFGFLSHVLTFALECFESVSLLLELLQPPLTPPVVCINQVQFKFECAETPFKLNLVSILASPDNAVLLLQGIDSIIQVTSRHLYIGPCLKTVTVDNEG